MFSQDPIEWPDEVEVLIDLVMDFMEKELC
jgi:hypothetical protein